jgi:hypothetical protein
MAYTPQHPENPCRSELSEAEQVPAKLWELLRRNERFQKAFSRLVQLDTRAEASLAKLRKLQATGVEQHHQTSEAAELRNECGRRSETRFLARRVLQNIRRSNAFAAAALEWLVPEPWFEIQHIAVHPGVDKKGKQYVGVKVVKIRGGSTPNPGDQVNWQEFVSQGDRDARSVRNLAGCAPNVRGPHITFTVTEDPDLQGSVVDGIQEYREYQAGHGPFTTLDSWRQTPPGFQRSFCRLWRQLDSRHVNPITKTRIDAPETHEVSFFEGWRLGALLAAVAQRGHLSVEDYAKAIQFDQIAENHRVFAVPNSIRTRSEARRVSNWLFEQLAAGLPGREPEVLGSPLQWDIFLTVRDLVRAGAPFDEALQESFEQLHLHADKWSEGRPMPNQKKAWAQRGADWADSYRFMDSPALGSGLVQIVFPGLANLRLPTIPQRS